MTPIRWTLPAHDDFLGLVGWIAARNPAAAAKVGRRILAAVERLARQPHQGPSGRAPGTRELVIPGGPYLVIYALEPGLTDIRRPLVVILRVLHGAMLWPPTQSEPDE
jgi:toxin ParE1/3/4